MSRLRAFSHASPSYGGAPKGAEEEGRTNDFENAMI